MKSDGQYYVMYGIAQLRIQILLYDIIANGNFNGCSMNLNVD